ncbi:hypothetical protein CYY_009585 [Polysphondylium violaceum]|uniref:Uncharacterized protein n=1 Tax=Polysphondylium violaceum TaxID=133409 RepID=A0A8J4PM69_9MYCE|nr:hypothetical protein CYY_009585 [Polysphondylium violaceum]
MGLNIQETYENDSGEHPQPSQEDAQVPTLLLPPPPPLPNNSYPLYYKMDNEYSDPEYNTDLPSEQQQQHYFVAGDEEQNENFKNEAYHYQSNFLGWSNPYTSHFPPTNNYAPLNYQPNPEWHGHHNHHNHHSHHNHHNHHGHHHNHPHPPPPPHHHGHHHNHPHPPPPPPHHHGHHHNHPHPSPPPPHHHGHHHNHPHPPPHHGGHKNHEDSEVIQSQHQVIHHYVASQLAADQENNKSMDFVMCLLLFIMGFFLIIPWYFSFIYWRSNCKLTRYLAIFSSLLAFMVTCVVIAFFATCLIGDVAYLT